MLPKKTEDFEIFISKVLIIDNCLPDTELLQEAIGKLYDISIAKCAKTAFKIIDKKNPDLIILDIALPGMNGFEICRHLKSKKSTKHIPVIFLTTLNEAENKTKGFSLGAVDYITKPFEISEIKARINIHLSIGHAKHKLQNKNSLLKQKIQKKTAQLLSTQEFTIEALASLAEYRDPETGGHIKRTKEYMKLLAMELKKKDKYKNLLNGTMIKRIYKSAPLHDIGKVAIPDSILLKEGPLTHEEFEEMKLHTVYGRDALINAELKLGRKSFLSTAKEIAYTHQEKWDGSGYPQGIKGKNIPLSGRMMAIADVYDALISKRPYKPPYPHDKAIDLIKQLKGIHFDPDIADTFLSINNGFRDIALKFADFEEERVMLIS